MHYQSEQALFDVAMQTPFFKKLSEGENCSKIVEPKGLFGIPDLLTVKISGRGPKTITTASFEMKLKNWKRALAQAFKYKAFSEFSYVVIDHHYARPALENINRFQKANIGLLSIDINGKIYSHVKPIKETPYCKSYKEQLYILVQPLMV
ncbi:MAG: hypothetical protein HGA96_05915 [Desulfobulbaceae bacterium]|nr:hypothetical protein [Desulfobulbaceae bacterium]